MTYLFNDPAQFCSEWVAGYAAAHHDKIYPVDGGVIRAHQAKPGQVVMIIGGGSGHYPAFGGFVGQGLAHGAALGNVFAAPSAQQICNVALSVNAGGGILFCYGNYAGDVLNFNQAQQQLQAMGIKVQSVVVTDDIASASIAEKHKRRGIAGTFPVFKAAAVAADAGKSLEEVVSIAILANERVRTIGVAFSGCTLPGANKPLFEVTAGTMEVGMGIHGEPGLERMTATTADDLAETLINKLLAEIPATIKSLVGARVGVILNGLGAVKYEELFVVYRKIDQSLSERGLIVVAPVVDELITSFDMAGISLTLFWLDDTLEQTWVAAADTPAFHRGWIEQPKENKVNRIQIKDKNRSTIGSADSQAAAAVVLTALEEARAVINAQQEKLGHLDAVAGDGDHGIGMQRGLTAAVEAAQEALAAKAGLGTLLVVAGDAWSEQAGGTSGALWGIILRSVGHSLGDAAKPDITVLATGIAGALNDVTVIGKAQIGDKTMIDVLHPFSSALSLGAHRSASIADAWSTAADIADQAALATKDLLPKIGRARPHAQKSLGTPDAGAVSMALIIRAVDRTLSRYAQKNPEYC